MTKNAAGCRGSAVIDHFLSNPVRPAGFLFFYNYLHSAITILSLEKDKKTGVAVRVGTTISLFLIL